MYSILIQDASNQTFTYYRSKANDGKWTCDTLTDAAKKVAELSKIYVTTRLTVVHNCNINYDTITVTEA